MKNKKTKRVTAVARCESFDIQISAEFTPRGLGSDEVLDVQKKLKNDLAVTIAKLPFAHIYPFEVRVR